MRFFFLVLFAKLVQTICSAKQKPKKLAHGATSMPKIPVKHLRQRKKRHANACISEKSSTFAADLESAGAKQETAGAVRLPEKPVYTYNTNVRNRRD
ncbi:hypothetical protein [Prevotellamassilia timonensis]|uniref:hypothetical protein n=1 Tax=Prevotellamassilia timonensis TaxID=1852370 RepID=UPI003080A7B9